MGELDEEDLEWLRRLKIAADLPGGWATHASFENFAAWNYVMDVASAQPSLEQLKKAGGKIGFVGHIHVQQAFWDSTDGREPETTGDQRWRLPEGMAVVVTVGSVGQPRDGDPRAAWTLWHPETRELEFRRTPYDVRGAAEAILAAGLPDELALRLFEGW